MRVFATALLYSSEMKIVQLVAICFVVFGVAQAVGASLFINEEISRLIDLRGHNVEVSLNITLAKGSKGGQYQVPIEPNVAKRLAFASARTGPKVLAISPTIDPGTDGYAVLNVALGENVEEVQIRFVFTGVQSALPKKILQEDNQFLVYTDTHYVISPYLTKTQTTKVWLASHHIEEYSEEADAAVDGARIVYGPYTDVKPYGSHNKTLRVHYENNSPAIRFPSVEQTLTLPSWGSSVEVSNQYLMEHAGALLKGRFSRLDYQLRNGPETDPSFRQVSVLVDDYEYGHTYSDAIGNITSSSMNFNESTLELDMRYPLFGGWKASFLTSHRVPLGKVHDSGSRKIFVRFGVPVKGAVTNHFSVDVVLPSGVVGKNFRAENSPYDVALSSFVNSKGSQVLRLSKENIVFDHLATLQIAYDSA